MVFDSLTQPDLFPARPRVLVFSCDAFDVMLTIAGEARGNRVTGTVFGQCDGLVVAIRRPTRAEIAVPVTLVGEERRIGGLPIIRKKVDDVLVEDRYLSSGKPKHAQRFVPRGGRQPTADAVGVLYAIEMLDESHPCRLRDV